MIFQSTIEHCLRARKVPRKKSRGLKVTILTIVLPLLGYPYRGSEQFIIIVHELQRYVQPSQSLRYVFFVPSFIFFFFFSPSLRPGETFLSRWLAYNGVALVLYVSVAICNDRRHHLHSTLHVPSVYSRKTCNRGDQSIYIQIPVLPETHATQRAMQTLPNN